MNIKERFMEHLGKYNVLPNTIKHRIYKDHNNNTKESLMFEMHTDEMPNDGAALCQFVVSDHFYYPVKKILTMHVIVLTDGENMEKRLENINHLNNSLPFGKLTVGSKYIDYSESVFYDEEKSGLDRIMRRFKRMIPLALKSFADAKVKA